MTNFLLGYRITRLIPSFNTQSQMVINTINPHSYATAKKDKIFKEALKQSDVLLPDGIGIVLAIRFLSGIKTSPITGSDIHQKLLEHAHVNKLKVFYLGASSQTLALIINKVEKQFPEIEIDTYSPPFKVQFSESDNLKMVRKVNSFQPDILFVGMTAPKQEKWVYQNKASLNPNIICSIGAVFDFYAGTIKRPRRFWQQIGLEWFVRLVNEPRRLFKRTLISAPVFLFDVIIAKVKQFKGS